MISASAVGQTIWTAKELGHQDWINVVEFSPDGSQLASGSVDASIILRDTETGRELRRFAGHTGPVNSVAFSPDGTRLISGSQDQSIRLWDVESGRELRRFAGHTGPVNSVDFSADGTQLISGSDDQSICLWDIAKTGQELQCFLGHTDSVNSVVFSPNGSYLISGSDDGSVRLWEVGAGRERQSFLKHTGPVNSVDFSPNGLFVLSGSDDGSASLWRVEDGREVQDHIHSDEVASVKFSRDGLRIISGTRNNEIILTDLETGQDTTLTTLYNNLSSVTFSPDNAHVSWAYGRVLPDGLKVIVIALSDAMLTETQHITTAHTFEINSVTFSPDDSQLASGSWDGSIRLWDPASGKVLRNIFHESRVLALSFSPDGTQIAAGLFRRGIVLSDVATGEELQRLTGVDDGNLESPVVFSPDGSQLASAPAMSGAIDLWDTSTGQILQSISGHTAPVTSIVFSPDGTQLISGSHDRSIRLWDIETGRELRHFLGHRATVYSVAISPDGSLLVSGSQDGSVRLWDVDTGEELQVFLGHFAAVFSVGFFPDGTRVVSGGSDQHIRQWNISTGEQMEALDHRALVRSVAISRNGKFLASAGRQTLKSWNLFGFSRTIRDYRFPLNQPVAHSTLPEATGGIAPINYMLTPTLPEGLNFDTSTRTISGTPTAVTAFPMKYTYTATDADGTTSRLLFKIHVYQSVSIESQSLPRAFTIVGNYPNPFREATQLTFDLPWLARIRVEVTDVLGRRVLTIPESSIPAGWSQTINLNGGSLPAGFYLYRLIANSSSGNSVQVGNFVRVH